MLLKTGQHGWRVYVPALEPVKRCGAGVGVVLLLVTLAGCAAPPGGPTARPYPVGVAYNLDLATTAAPSASPAAMAADFAQIGQLGFDTVVAPQILGAGWKEAVRAAGQEGLALAGPPREVLYYLRSGRLPNGCRDVAELAARNSPSELPKIVLLGDVVDAATAERAKGLAGAYRELPNPPVTLALLAGPDVEPSMVQPAVGLAACFPEWAGRGPAGAAMRLDCLLHRNETIPRASARWLKQYHAGLAAGLTGGVIVESPSVVPGQWRGQVVGPDRSGRVRGQVLRQIAARASRWGSRLRRVAPRDIRPLGPVSDSLRVVLFSGDKRRFVMLFNTSTERFVRGSVDLPAALGSRPVRRAVRVPDGPYEPVGEIAEPHTGGLSLDMDLAPGDAALWELF